MRGRFFVLHQIFQYWYMSEHVVELLEIYHFFMVFEVHHILGLLIGIAAVMFRILHDLEPTVDVVLKHLFFATGNELKPS